MRKLTLLWVTAALLTSTVVGYKAAEMYRYWSYKENKSNFNEFTLISDELSSLRGNNSKLREQITRLQNEVYKTDRMELYAKLQRLSVKVIVNGGTGTGVVFSRDVNGKRKTFVWTAGHVAESMMKEDGTFGEVTISEEIRKDGKLIETISSMAKVIAYSPPTGGEDLALLEVLDDKFTTDESTVFNTGEIQQVGTEVIHVGCTLGLEDSVSLGIVSQTDRNLMEDGRCYDQTSCAGYPGSSGGGVYTTDGECIGLLVRGAGPGLNFIVPMRRINKWAAENGLLWALHAEMEVPLVRQPTALESTPAAPAEIDLVLPVDGPK